jgi:hypothetical protein
MARLPGPIRKYTVYYVAPLHPGRWRVAVDMADETTGRDSAIALSRMHHAVLVEVILLGTTASRPLIDRFTAGEWDRYGKLVYRYTGRNLAYVPAWATGGESLEREKPDEHRGTRGSGTGVGAGGGRPVVGQSGGDAGVPAGP